MKALTESPLVDRLDVVALHDQPETAPDTDYWHLAHTAYTPCGGDRLAFSRAVAQRMLTTSYDRVLSGHVYLTPLPFLLGAARRSDHLVTFIYGLDATNRLPWYRRLPLIRSRTIIAITQFTADLAAKANALPGGKTRILHNCLDPVFAASQRHQDSCSASVPQFGQNSILTVSRLSRNDAYKGHDVVLRALPAVLRHVPDAMYYIVGEGELRAELERQVDAQALREHVRFLGSVSDAALARCYEMARVFVMPSKAEGFGFVFLEAMSYGRPVIAGTRDAAPEVLGNGEAGLLVDPDDVNQIAAAVTQIMLDSELRERLGAAGRARADKMFGFPLFKQRLEAHLTELDRGAADS